MGDERCEVTVILELARQKEVNKDMAAGMSERVLSTL